VEQPAGAASASAVDRQLPGVGRAEPLERERSDHHRGAAGELSRHEYERGRVVERHRPDLEPVEPAAARTRRRVRAGGQIEVGDPRLDVEDRSAVEQVDAREFELGRADALDAHQAQADAVGTGRVAAGEDPGARAAVGEQERDGPQRAGGVVGVTRVDGAVEEGHEPGPVEAVETVEGGGERRIDLDDATRHRRVARLDDDIRLRIGVHHADRAEHRVHRLATFHRRTAYAKLFPPSPW
jgi:hypothetical protein